MSARGADGGKREEHTGESSPSHPLPLDHITPPIRRNPFLESLTTRFSALSTYSEHFRPRSRCSAGRARCRAS